MSWEFDGSDDYIEWNVGACNLTGAWTQVFVILLNSGVSWQSYISNENSSFQPLVSTTRHSSGNLTSIVGNGANLQQLGISHSNSDGWMLLANTRTGGASQTPRGHKIIMSSGVATHVNAGATQNNQATQAGGRIIFGHWSGSDYFSGKLVVAAEWASALSDGQIESLHANFTRDDWLALSPAGLWDGYDQFATDRTGNSADRSAIIGTTEDTGDDPDGWSDWEGGAPPPTTSFPFRSHRQLASIYRR